jgi:hypothetical protein
MEIVSLEAIPAPQFLGAFVKLRKSAFSFVISVRPSVRPPARQSYRMEEIGSHWTHFHEI